MTAPVSNEADKPATSGGGTSTNSKSQSDAKSKSSGGTVKVRLLARSWQCPVEDDKGRVTFLRYGKGAELEVSEEVFEKLAGENAFKPAFEKVEAEA